MFLIKHLIITHFLIKKIINIMKKSIIDSSKIGKEFSLFYFYLFNNNYLLSSNKNKLAEHKDEVYYLINKLNTEFNLSFNTQKFNYINLNEFINLFNKKLFKLPIQIIFSFLRGYYLNNLILYSTNINSKLLKNKNHNTSLYFVLYDFHDIYLNFIYNFILNKISFNPKIKYLINTEIDKYSINELTDRMPYKLVFLHKIKYYHNIILHLLTYLFYDVNNIQIDNINYISIILNEDELYIYNIYNSFKY